MPEKTQRRALRLRLGRDGLLLRSVGRMGIAPAAFVRERQQSARSSPSRKAVSGASRCGCRTGEPMEAISNRELNRYQFTVRPLSTEEGGRYLVEYQDIPGCMSDGETIAEAIANGREALRDSIAPGGSYSEPPLPSDVNGPVELGGPHAILKTPDTGFAGVNGVAGQRGGWINVEVLADVNVVAARDSGANLLELGFTGEIARAKPPVLVDDNRVDDGAVSHRATETVAETKDLDGFRGSFPFRCVVVLVAA
jgi:antitoxin HicB